MIQTQLWFRDRRRQLRCLSRQLSTLLVKWLVDLNQRVFNQQDAITRNQPEARLYLKLIMWSRHQQSNSNMLSFRLKVMLRLQTRKGWWSTNSIDKATPILAIRMFLSTYRNLSNKKLYRHRRTLKYICSSKTTTSWCTGQQTKLNSLSWFHKQLWIKKISLSLTTQYLWSNLQIRIILGQDNSSRIITQTISSKCSTGWRLIRRLAK